MCIKFTNNLFYKKFIYRILETSKLPVSHKPDRMPGLFYMAIEGNSPEMRK